MFENQPIKLSNGRDLPLVGLGTWLARDPDELKPALRAAFDVGYRYIDTASIYQNEKIIGEVLHEYYDADLFTRSAMFLTSKLPYYGHEDPDYFLKQTLKDLQTDYLDLYLIHSPCPCKLSPNGQEAEQDADGNSIPVFLPLIDTWRFMEQHYKRGVLKAIGISNFNAKQLQDLYDQAEIKPHNLQIELHMLHPQYPLVALCKQPHIAVTAYGSLGSPGSVAYRSHRGVQADCLLSHPLVIELAQKYHKTTAQILLRQIIQRGINVIPKSVHPKRLIENINIFDFRLSDEDMQRFTEIKEDVQMFNLRHMHHHPWNPWKNEV